MLEKLIDILKECWDTLAPFEVVEAYNRGGVLRFGRYHRTLESGFHWKWPFVERVVWVLACETTQRLPAQSLTTKDDVGVVVAAIVRYQITRIEPYITDIWDQQDVLTDVAMGAVRTAVGELTYGELIQNPPEKRVLELVRDRVNRYGFKVHAITFTDICRARSLRLIQPLPAHLAN